MDTLISIATRTCSTVHVCMRIDPHSEPCNAVIYKIDEFAIVEWNKHDNDYKMFPIEDVIHGLLGSVFADVRNIHVLPNPMNYEYQVAYGRLPVLM